MHACSSSTQSESGACLRRSSPAFPSFFPGQCLEAGHDVEKLFRDRLLTPLVVVEGKSGQVAHDFLSAACMEARRLAFSLARARPRRGIAQ